MAAYDYINICDIFLKFRKIDLIYLCLKRDMPISYNKRILSFLLLSILFYFYHNKWEDKALWLSIWVNLIVML